MPVNFLPLPAWDDSGNSDFELSSKCDSSYTDWLTEEWSDRTSQWIADLDEVAGMGNGEMEDEDESGEFVICDHEMWHGEVEGMECQDISERIFNPLASLWLASNNETSLVPDVQNEEPVSQIHISVTDHDCDQ